MISRGPFQPKTFYDFYDNFLPGEGREQHDEASLLKNLSTSFNALEAQADEKHFSFLFK